MRRRLLITVLLGLGIGLGVVTPAQAKGPTEARITGPQLPAPLRVSNAELSSLADATAASDLLYRRPSGLRFTVEAPPGDLGPGYTVRYTMGEQVLLRQRVHPYAAGGAAVLVPPGQHNMLLDEPFEAGWTRLPAQAADRLVALGLPRRAAPVEPSPLAAAASAPSAPSASRSTPAGIVAGVGAGTTLLVGAGVWLSRRRRRRAVAA
jgi:hypothetical protein